MTWRSAQRQSFAAVLPIAPHVLEDLIEGLASVQGFGKADQVAVGVLDGQLANVPRAFDWTFDRGGGHLSHPGRDPIKRFPRQEVEDGPPTERRVGRIAGSKEQDVLIAKAAQMDHGGLWSLAGRRLEDAPEPERLAVPSRGRLNIRYLKAQKHGHGVDVFQGLTPLKLDTWCTCVLLAEGGTTLTAGLGDR